MLMLLAQPLVSGAAESIFDDDWSPTEKPQPLGPPAAVTPAPSPQNPLPTPATTKPASAPAAIRRLALPTKAEIASATKAVAADHAGEYGKTDPEQMLAASTRLVEAAEQAEVDPAQRYVLLRDAANMAANAGDGRRAEAAADRISQIFVADVLDLKLSLLSAAAARSSSADSHRPIAAAALVLMERALTSGAFDSAGKAATLAESSAAKAKDAGLIDQVKSKGDLVRRVQAAYAEIAPSLATLKKDRTNADANLAVGRFYSFIAGNWEKGLEHLRAGSDAELKALADRERAGARDSASRLRLADGWWDWSRTQSGAYADAAKLRAADFYRDAQQEATGASLAKIEKRLAEAEPKVQTVNLLRLAKLPRDRISGDWNTKNGVILSGLLMTSRLQFPYMPPREYDYRVEVSVVKGSGIVTQILPKRRAVESSEQRTGPPTGGNFVWGAFSTTMSLDGLAAGDVRTTRHLRIPIRPSDRLIMLVKVRNTGVKTYINGVLAVDLKTDFNDTLPYASWQLKDPRCLGIGASGTTVVFIKAEVREISGPGTRVE